MSRAPNKFLESFCRWSLGAFILTLPFQTQLFIHQADWGRGFSNPYVSIVLLLSESFLLFSSILFFSTRIKDRWKYGDLTLFKVLLFTIGVVLLSLFATPYNDLLLHGLMLIKALEALLLYMLTTNGILKQNQILKLFIGIMTAEALLGTGQVLFQSNFGLGILGEPSLSLTTPHLAKIHWGDLTWIRAYGTFPHPNVLGGFLVVSLLATFLYNPTKKYEREILLGIQFIGLLATCSRSALLAFSSALILLCFWYAGKLRKKGKAMFGTLTFIFIVELCFLFWSRGTLPWNDPALLSRWSGYKEAVELFMEHPLGVGWNHYTLFLDKVTPTALAPWEYQPVHNVYLLALTETGVLGFGLAVIALSFILKKMHALHKTFSTQELAFKKRVFSLIGIAVLIIGLFDHYWLSLEQGRLLLILLWGMFAHFVSDPLQVFKIKKEAKHH